MFLVSTQNCWDLKIEIGVSCGIEYFINSTRLLFFFNLVKQITLNVFDLMIIKYKI